MIGDGEIALVSLITGVLKSREISWAVRRRGRVGGQRDNHMSFVHVTFRVTEPGTSQKVLGDRKNSEVKMF